IVSSRLRVDMRRLLLLFFILQFVRGACPDGFELTAAGQCSLLTPITVSNVAYTAATNTAISKCKEMQAQPIIIHYAEQNSYWASQFNKNLVQPLGLVCNTSSLKWQWTDGSAVDYKPAAGYFAELNSNCKTASLWYMASTSGYWYYTESTATNTFNIFCTTQLPHPIPSGDGCESFEDDNEDGVCYQVGASAENWQEAQTICRSFNANVASIHNLKENSFLRRLAVSKGAVSGMYLGATMIGKGNDFGWIDGSEWNYDNFFNGFPMQGLGDCLIMDTEDTSGQWVNVDCSSKLAVACMRQQHYSTPSCTSGPWQEEQIIYSPAFPLNASSPCEFILTVDAGKRVEVEILLLEANSCCDNLIIYENYFGGTIIANLTGEVGDKKYTTSSSNYMRVSWQPTDGKKCEGSDVHIPKPVILLISIPDSDFTICSRTYHTVSINA
ncbi:hypothetical protein PRIPAC_85134, partial [Pristionchus pacificus]